MVSLYTNYIKPYAVRKAKLRPYALRKLKILIAVREGGH